ncbi:MAG TPA: site-specific DNA-methyltransferase [Phototrophicaceae bacterium]|nr:site-specific DNA-methyltransferase [Phototrophicaceae bacterium]
MTLPLFPPDETVTDHFEQDERIVLHQGDVDSFVRTLPDQSVRLIVTSPPYNLGKSYETRVSIQDYLEAQTQTIAQLCRVLKDDGSICWQVGNFVQDGEVFPLDMYYYPIFKHQGLFLRNRIIWHFGHGLHASKRFSGRYETLLWFTKSDKYIFNLDDVRVPSKYPGKRHFKGAKRGQPSGNPKGKNPSDIWEVVAQDWETCLWDIPNVKSNHPEKTIHPCQFPVELVERCVLALTDEEDWVFDPYAGVGSSLIAGLMHNRRVIGCEKESEYVEITRERITAFYNGTLKTRAVGTPIYQPTGKEKVAQVPEEWSQLKDES